MKEFIHNLINTQVRNFIINILNKDINAVISALLGGVYPIIDIYQVEDAMFITYVPKPEDEALKKILPKKFIPINNLAKFDHIVVLMQENRSFDHMLKYLKVEEGRQDVDGLTGNESNIDIGIGPDQQVHKVFHNHDTQIKQDPCHALKCVMRQIGTSMDGFVKDFCLRYPVRDNPNNREIWKNVMSYYGKEELPTFRLYCQ